MLLVRRRRKDRLRPFEAPAAGVERHLIRAEHEFDVRCAVARRLLDSRSAVAKRWRVYGPFQSPYSPTLQSETFMPASQCTRRATSGSSRHPPAVHARRDSPLVRAARRFVVYGGRRLRRTDAARFERGATRELAIDDLHADAEPLCAARLKRGSSCARDMPRRNGAASASRRAPAARPPTPTCCARSRAAATAGRFARQTVRRRSKILARIVRRVRPGYFP